MKKTISKKRKIPAKSFVNKLPPENKIVEKPKFKPKDWSEVVKPGRPKNAIDIEENAKTPRVFDPWVKDNPLYVRRWYDFVGNVTSRENFKEGHLTQLDILCKLYVEEHILSQYIKENGYSYISHGRNGAQYKAHPEVSQRNRVLGEIRNYSKMLGLTLVKDTDFSNDPKKDDEDWK